MSSKGKTNKYIDEDLISELVYHEEKFIKEFADASRKSFTEFRENYSKFLLKRDETNFRKAGHKIKPVAQMLNIDDIIEEYEHAKTLIWQNKDQEKLERSADKITRICDTIIAELKAIHDK